MRITILGAAAGGGFPQWNCNCRLCRGVREGSVRARPRTQSSIFVRPGIDGGADPRHVDGILFNASPDVLEQIRACPALQPARQARDSAIAAVVLMDGQIDHVTGLAMLRERTAPLPLWCTDPVHEDLTRGNPILSILGHYCGVDRHRIDLGRPFPIDGVADLELVALPLDSKAAPYSPHREAGVPGDNIGITIRDRASGGSLFYAPGLGAVTPAVFDAMGAASLVLVDGTFWTDDEMIGLGLSRKRAREIGHLPQSGPGGMLEWLARLPATTSRALIHVNNTNPILDEDSPQRAVLDAAGITVCADGMHWSL